MAWDTRKQPPVVVKDGETTTYNMLITPRFRRKTTEGGRTLVEALSKKPSDRTAQILLEFRKLNHTVDECELWCLLMASWAVGRDSVPQLCAELDRTTDNRMLRRLGFALRAIGDARAVPALIRAIPKTLLPSSSDYGLIVGDKELTEFMQTHDLNKGKEGRTSTWEGPCVRFRHAARPDRQNFDDPELFSMSLNEDHDGKSRTAVFTGDRRRWQTWWEANWQNSPTMPHFKR